MQFILKKPSRVKASAHLYKNFNELWTSSSRIGNQKKTNKTVDPTAEGHSEGGEVHRYHARWADLHYC